MPLKYLPDSTDISLVVFGAMGHKNLEVNWMEVVLLINSRTLFPLEDPQEKRREKSLSERRSRDTAYPSCLQQGFPGLCRTRSAAS